MRHKGKFYIFFVIALLFSGLTIFTACEDTIEPETFGAISGRIIYEINEEPVVNASITTNPPSDAVITDSEGYFVLEGVLSGNVAVIIRKTGFRTETINIRVREGHTSQLVVPLASAEGRSQGPLAPREPVPATNSRNQPTTLQLSWAPSNTAQGDSVWYDILLFESDSTSGKRIAENHTDTTFTLRNLRSNTVYFWQVLARDKKDNVNRGPIWAFRTATSDNSRLLFSPNIGSNIETSFTDTIKDAPTFRLTISPSREYSLINPTRARIAFTSSNDAESHIYRMSPGARM